MIQRTGAFLLILLAGNARADELAYPDPAAAATPDYYAGQCANLFAKSSPQGVCKSDALKSS